MANVWHCTPEYLDTLIHAYCDSTNDTDATNFNDTVRNLRIHLRCVPDAHMFTSTQLDQIIRKALDNPRRVGTTFQRYLTTSALIHPACTQETLRYACAYHGYNAYLYRKAAIENPNCPEDAKVYAFLAN
jgi:hypothetical protein